MLIIKLHKASKVVFNINNNCRFQVKINNIMICKIMKKLLVVKLALKMKRYSNKLKNIINKDLN